MKLPCLISIIFMLFISCEITDPPGLVYIPISSPERFIFSHIDNHTIELFWDIHPRGSDNRFSLSRNDGSQEVVLDSVISSYDYTDSSLDPGNSYQYKLIAYNYYDTSGETSKPVYLNIAYGPSNRMITELDTPFHVAGLVFSDYGDLLHIYGDSLISTWETTNWMNVKMISDKDRRDIYDLVYSANSAIYAYQITDKIKIFDAKTDTLIRSINWGSLCHIAISGDGERIIAANNKGSLKVFKVHDPAYEVLLDDSLASAWDLEQTPDGKKLIFLAYNAFNVYDLENLCLLNKYGNTNPTIDLLILSSDNQRFLGFNYYHIYSWDINAFERKELIYSNQYDFYDIAESPDQKYIVASDNYLLRVFDEESKTLIRTLSEHTNLIFNLVYSPVANVFVSSDLNNKTIVWSEEIEERWHIK